MVRAAMAELQLVGRCRPSPGRGSDGRGRCRTPARRSDERSGVLDRIGERRGIAGPLLRNTPSGFGREQLPRPASWPDTPARRSHARSAAAGCSTSSRSRRPRFSAAASRDGSGATPNSPGSSSGQSNARSRRHAAHQIGAFHRRNGTRALDERLASSASPVAMTPRMTPPDRSRRVSARVSMSEIATMPLAAR